MPNLSKPSEMPPHGLKRSSAKTKALAAAKILNTRLEARHDFLAFTKATMPGYFVGWHHRLIADKIHEMEFGDLRRLIISLPPRHGKSELASRRLPAWILGRNPETSIIATSYGADLSSMMNRDVQRIMDTPAYKTIFPHAQLGDMNVRTLSGGTLRNSSVFEIANHKGVYRSAGVGGGITGMGGKWLICDDPIKARAEADSPVYRQKIWDWYSSTFYSRQEHDARIILIMTRWHADDLAGRLIAKALGDTEADQWDVIQLPAISSHTPQPYDPRGPGEALWPEKYPLKKLHQMKASIDDYEWAALYDQDPKGSGGVEWPTEYFGADIWFDEWPSDLKLKTIGVDPSKGASAKSGDYGAIIRMGLDANGVMWVEAELERLPAEALVDTVIEAQDQFRADVIAFEANQFQELLAVGVREKALQSGFPVPVQSIINTVSKVVRIRRLGPYLRQKQFRFKANHKGTRILVKQLADFPHGDYDDGPDAMEMALRSMVELHNGRAANTRASGGVRS